MSNPFREFTIFAETSREFSTGQFLRCYLLPAQTDPFADQGIAM